MTVADKLRVSLEADLREDSDAISRAQERTKYIRAVLARLGTFDAAPHPDEDAPALVRRPVQQTIALAIELHPKGVVFDHLYAAVLRALGADRSDLPESVFKRSLDGLLARGKAFERDGIYSPVPPASLEPEPKREAAE